MITLHWNYELCVTLISLYPIIKKIKYLYIQEKNESIRIASKHNSNFENCPCAIQKHLAMQQSDFEIANTQLNACGTNANLSLNEVKKTTESKKTVKIKPRSYITIEWRSTILIRIAPFPVHFITFWPTKALVQKVSGPFWLTECEILLEAFVIWNSMISSCHCLINMGIRIAPNVGVILVG